MKTLRILLASMLIVLLATPSYAADRGRINPTIPVSNTTAESAKAETLLRRLEEIKSMDQSTLSRSTRRELHKEVRTIKKELKRTGGGVYLSVGAVIIIILLLILLV